jgi:hypothetical protein
MALVDKLWPQPPKAEPKASQGLPNRTRCNFSRQLGVLKPIQQEMAVMDRDNIVVGNKTPPAKPATAIAEHPPHGPAISGAMSQQRGDLSNQSSPQKFVHLVGCRDPKVRALGKS